MSEATQAADRKPLRFDGKFLWHNAGHPFAEAGDYPDYLPAEVFLRLDGYEPREDPALTEMVRAYPTAAAAEQALARATSQGDPRT
jgi:hypothetical protein